MFAPTPRIEIISRVILTAVIVFNAFVPAAALATSGGESGSRATDAAGQELPRTLPEQKPVFFDPPAVVSPQQTSPEPDGPRSPVPPREEVEFTIVAEPAVVPVNGLVTFLVHIHNHSGREFTALTFSDSLELGLEYNPDGRSPVAFDSQTREVTHTIDRLGIGQESSFSYSVTMGASKRNAIKGKVWLHNVELKSSESGLNLKTSAAVGHALPTADAESELVALQPGGGWNTLGRVSVHMPKDNAGANALVQFSPTKIAGKGPALQFKLDVFETTSMAVDSLGKFNEQSISLKKEHKEKFKTPAFLEINLDGYVDLTNVPAGQEPYVATYDETHKIWVKVPILEENYLNNSVTVEAAHFSTWGAGLGSSLPQNGANVLLFDQPYTSLFTGSSRYSIPVWTPPGRAGMQPEISLSYSSGTVDGVLGDVQAPWVGVGWNIDDVEVVRKITTDENGYGYKNEFALTLNGSLYQLVRDEFHQNRYFTDQAAFLYIERHNYPSGSPSTANATGEWWEVVTTDGTRYRLGWNNDSEQLALMYGYSCTTDGWYCQTPDSPAYQLLDYAGKATDLVAMRWRVDRVNDTHGNYMEYHYEETQPDPATTLAPFDRESYLQSISYAGFDDPDPADGITPHLEPAYQVVFKYGDRSTIGDVPTEYNIWDNIDVRYLSDIWSCYGTCTSNGSNAIRRYHFGYSLANVPNVNGTLTLTSLKFTGGGYIEKGQEILATDAPTIRFTYQNLSNRDITGTTNDAFTYPRLATIDNGSGGLLTFTYEQDGRGTNSWYNHRVSSVLVDSGMGLAKKQSYTYETPVYSGEGGNTSLGSLTGYTTVIENLLDFLNGDAAIVKTKHTFGTKGLDTGREMQTEWLDGTDTTLRKTTNIYVTDNRGAPKDYYGNPFSGWNYRYLAESATYERSGGALILTSKNTYYNDPFTGNLLIQSTFLENSLYRKTYYEYMPPPAKVTDLEPEEYIDPKDYILDKVSRALLLDAANQVYSDTRYHYDGKIKTAPTRGDVTLVQRLTGDPADPTQTVDTTTVYNPYGNVIRTQAYPGYGHVDSLPVGTPRESTTEYDSVQNDPTQSYPIKVTNALGQFSTMAYLYTLGVPYQVTDLNGWTTSTTYDGLGRTLSVTPPGLGQAGTWFIYPSVDANGRITAPHSIEMQILDTIAGRYRSVWGIYDGAGRMLQTQVDAGAKLLVNTTRFNAQGLPIQQSLPFEEPELGGRYVYRAGDQFTTTEYDALGRVTGVTAPGGITSHTSYDGLTTTSTDPNGNKVSRTTDGLGRMVSVAEFSDSNTVYATTSYFYDSADRLVEVRDAKSNQTRIWYDWLGRKIKMDDPDMGEWTYVYDALGNMVSQTDSRLCQLSFTYDELNRLETKSSADAAHCKQDTEASYVYDIEDDPDIPEYNPVQDGTVQDRNAGLRTYMEDPSGSTTWTYSNFGRTVKETRTIGGIPHWITTNADWLGRAMSTSYDDGEVITYTYDELGRPNKLSSSQSVDPLVDLVYNVLGQIEEQTLGNGTVIENSYDAGTTRLTDRKAEHVNGGVTTTLLNLSYTYDPNGNITRLQDNGLSETQFYNYDFLNRLTSALGAQGTPTAAPADPQTYGQAFEYDEVGNILQVHNWGTAPSLPTATSTSSPTETTTATPTNTATPSDTPVTPQGRAPLDGFVFAKFVAPQSVSVSRALLAPAYQEDPIPTNTPPATGTPLPPPTYTFTPTAIPNNENTVALLHMNGEDAATTFTDETGKVWTAVGNAQIDTEQFAFGEASGSFDGTGDYIHTPDHANFDVGSGDFTVDFWFRKNANGTIQAAFGQGNSSATGTSVSIYGYMSLADNKISIRGYQGSVLKQLNSSGTVTDTNWHHYAAARSGNTLYLFLDGANQGTLDVTGVTFNNSANKMAIGRMGEYNSQYANGWIDDFRFTKGVARWTSDFTPPDTEHLFATATPTPTLPFTPTATATTAPVIDNSYTVALLHMRGPDESTVFPDESSKVWTAADNAQVDTAQSVFGGTSGLFDGTGDRLTAPDNVDWRLDAGSDANKWTIDMRVRFNGDPGTGLQGLAQQYVNGSNWWGVYLQSNILRFAVRSGGTTTVNIGNAWDPDGDTWYHIAVVKNGTAGYLMFVDGVQIGTAITDTNVIPDFAGTLRIGDSIDSAGAPHYLNGWLDEVRFSKGIAHWTSDFTPPASEYAPGTASDSLMAYWDFDNLTSTTVPDVASAGIVPNDATLQNGAASILEGAEGQAVSFDGTDDAAVVTDQTEIRKMGSFTLSAWINPSSLVADRTQYIINKGVSATDFDYGFITTTTSGTATPTSTPPGNVDANGKLVFRVGDLTPNRLIGPVLPVNAWTLVTGVYDSVNGQLRLYINGRLTAAEKVTGTVNMGTGALKFSSPSPNQYHGKLDEVRFYNRALTDNEVSAMFESLPPPTPFPTTPPPPPTAITPTGTPLPASQQQWGTGLDGTVTVNAGETYNINALPSKIDNRTCPDAVSYSVTSLTNARAYLSTAPTAECLKPGDEVMLINLQGTSSGSYNAGTYEFLRVASIGADPNFVQFTTMKLHWYGTGWHNDTSIGIQADKQKVMLIRVPNYQNVEVNGTLTANAWNGKVNGLVIFRVSGTLSGSGTIDMNAKGYRGGPSALQGEGHGGAWTTGRIRTSNRGGGGAGYGDQQNGGGAGYALAGQASTDTYGGLGGLAYGDGTLNMLVPGSGGGGAEYNNAYPSDEETNHGGHGGNGGGIVFVIADQINFTGTITANGGGGEAGRPASWNMQGGSGSGGSVRIEGRNITLNTITVAGAAAYADGSVGRIAVYHENSQNPPSITSSNPTPYIAWLGALQITPTPATPTPTPNPFHSPYGNGRDGDLLVGASTTFNISTQSQNLNRTCTNGGDAVSYSVKELTSSSATLLSAPASGCLVAGDEILLINLRGKPTNTVNTGKYEFLRVSGVVGDTVYFLTPKVNHYGANANDDSGVGTDQMVTIYRVPNYEDVTVNGTLTANAWDGKVNGLVIFRVLGTLNGTGTIDMNAKGYRGGPSALQGEGHGGAWTTGRIRTPNLGGGGAGYGDQQNGGGAGYALAGQASTDPTGGLGGLAYGDGTLNMLVPGSGGGGAEYNNAYDPSEGSNHGGHGGNGGGIVFVIADQIDFTGTITANGGNGEAGIPASWNMQGGSGSGGSVRIEGRDITLNTITVAGATAYADGSRGRVAVYYSQSMTGGETLCSQASTYCRDTNVPNTPTPTPTATSTLLTPTGTLTSTPTSTPSPTPIPQGWYESDYTYSTDMPHAATSVNRGSFADSFHYDLNGNMDCRTESGVTFVQTYSAENRIASIQKLASGTCETPGPVTAKWDFTYDGDGTRTGQSYTPYTDGEPEPVVITRYYFGGAFETTGTTWKKYYSFAGQTIIRDANGFKYILGDHLGSTSVVLDATGTVLEQQRYLPFGQARVMPPYASVTSTDFTYTGQRNIPGTGLMDYKARFYSTYLNQFTQPDTIVPDLSNPQSLNRYSYVLNNPIRYNDPSGHKACDEVDANGKCYTENDITKKLEKERAAKKKQRDDKARVDAIAKALSSGALVLDALALGISILGTITEGVGLALGESFTPLPGIDGAVGLIGAILLYNMYLNPFENALSGLSLLMTASADWITQQTHFQTAQNPYTGAQSTELVLGADTTFALASVGVGNIITPEAATDTVVNLATSHYDFTRLGGGKPVWGLFQYHIGHENGSSPLNPLSWYDFATHEN